MSGETPKTHKAAIYDNPGIVSTKIVDVATPELNVGEVLVRLTHSGVCHSDLAVMTNSWDVMPHPTPKGQVGGHEGVGVVVKLGPGVKDTIMKIGDRVGIKWVGSVCNRCAACIDQADGVCFGRTISGYFRPGTFQQYVVGPVDYVTPIPDSLSSADAAPMLCAGITMYAALRKSNARGGDWLVISGAGGGLGHIGVQVAARGLGLRVIGIDHGSKKQLVLDSGAEHFVDVTKGDSSSIIEEVKSLTGNLGSHAAIVCAASNDVYTQALQFLRFGGTLVCVGIPEGVSVPIGSAKPSHLIVSQLNITAVSVGNKKDAEAILEMAARGIVKTNYTLEPLENLTDIFQRMSTGNLQGRVVVGI
ncbi:uncharacterized protein N7458_005853 [Penicillium daleae]|uniref:Enoyl reductase (ER) domain-containing protein n=1 Tax=Penicillium daleae TaxID=63821 RepID=A0AAD6CBH4_9EURO|nr:uncharacterized protein N7458_005853 [Penicillium daleae]KAJ5454897.1 hypothetical protein N7458_005853 [Penicillium daleae]